MNKQEWLTQLYSGVYGSEDGPKMAGAFGVIERIDARLKREGKPGLYERQELSKAKPEAQALRRVSPGYSRVDQLAGFGFVAAMILFYGWIICEWLDKFAQLP